MARGIPLLGICQGAQSIAHVLGAAVGPRPGEPHEFGYDSIHATDAGKVEAIAAGAPVATLRKEPRP